MENLIYILFSAAFINNFVLIRFLGICPFLGVSKKSDAAFGMGAAVLFVMMVATPISWMVQHFILNPLGAEFLQTIFFILIIAALVQFIEMVINKTSPALKKSLGIYLPLITTNCAILGVAVLNIMENYTFLESLFHSLGAGIGFIIALMIMSGIRERLDEADVPKAFAGVPVAFVVAGILSLAFTCFASF